MDLKNILGMIAGGVLLALLLWLMAPRAVELAGVFGLAAEVQTLRNESARFGEALEIHSERAAEQFAILKAIMITVAGNTDTPLSQEALEELVSSVQAISDSKALYVEEVEIVDLDWFTASQFPHWTTRFNAENLTITETGEIGHFLADSTLFGHGDTTWVATDDGLELHASSEAPSNESSAVAIVKISSPGNVPTSPEILGAQWASELNLVGHGVASLEPTEISGAQTIHTGFPAP